MQQPAAQRVFRRRQAMLEPVFARLRGRQQLNRFRRRGLAAVSREFALHALAYNLARAVGAWAAFYVYLLAVWALLGRNHDTITHVRPHIRPNGILFDTTPVRTHG